MTTFGVFLYLCFGLLFQLVFSGVPGIKLKPVQFYDDQTEYFEYNSVVGDKVVLPCNITPPSFDDSVALVLWYIGDSGNPIYSVDARNEPVKEGKHFSSDILGSRAKFNISVRNSFLVIEPVKAGDSGEYRCRVDFRRGRTQNRKLKVNVIVPPKDIYVQTGDKKFQDTVIGPINEGNALNLTCIAVGGNPSPSVKWWRGEALMDDSYTILKEGAVVNSLEIEAVNRNLSKSTITCQAMNTNLTMPKSVTIKLDVNLKPQYVRISTKKKKLEVDIEQKIKCSTGGSFPAAEMTWWLDGKKIDDDKQTLIGNSSTTASVLTFIPMMRDNKKTLICRAANPRLPESAVEDTWKLDIYYQPELSLVLGASVQDEQIREGHDVYFECNVNANPEIREVEWLLDGDRLFSDPSKGIFIMGKSLRLENVGKQHRGTYQCQADNAVGRDAPVCASGQMMVYGVGRNERAQITCYLEADPGDVSFRWGFKSSKGRVDVVTFNSSGTTSTAYFTPKTKYDYGTLFCLGKNNVGEQQKPCVFSIIQAGKPEPVSNCTLKNKTADSISLACTAGDDGGLLQQFHLEVYSKKYHRLLVNQTSLDHPVFEVTGLPSGSPLKVVIYASNSKGKSKDLVFAASTFLSAETHTGTLSQVFISPVLAVLLGIMLVLVIMTIVILVIVKRRRSEANRGDVPATEVENKSDDHKKVNPSNLADTKDKCPDVIPPRNVSTGTDYTNFTFNDLTKTSDSTSQRIYENMNNQREHTYENLINKPIYSPKQKDEEVMYAELALPENKSITVRKPDGPPVEYADIDFQKSRKPTPSPSNETEEEEDGVSVETPLMNNQKDDKKINCNENVGLEREKPKESMPI
ncbi:nephrin-like isoform X2 [Tachypleus tridentatus]|uniref:nephrin-like isoform X2 n=1 Tax=Tachypleus tridentatus TaxID=6853 RepID=UPI003FD47A58